MRWAGYLTGVDGEMIKNFVEKSKGKRALHNHSYT